MTRVAVVTGANKGVGLQIVKDLCKQFVGDIFLTSRDECRGQAAVQKLMEEGLHPKYYNLDISDHDSIVRFRDFLVKTYGGLDVLVNNAAILYEFELFSEICPDETPAVEVPLSEIVETTCQINFFGTLDTCEVLFPILRPHARVCNISSGAGKKALDRCSEAWREKLLNPYIDMEELKTIFHSYVKAAKENKLIEEGFPKFAYGMSKLAVNVMTAIQQRDVDKKDEDILINACSPGFVATEMTQHKGHLTVEEGAETPVYVALLPANLQEPRGKFIRNKMISQEKQGC